MWFVGHVVCGMSVEDISGSFSDIDIGVLFFDLQRSLLYTNTCMRTLRLDIIVVILSIYIIFSPNYLLVYVKLILS